MARHPKQSPLKDSDVRVLAGSAVLAEIAIAAGGIWNLTALEDLIDDKRDGYTGQYRKMLNGVLPRNEECMRITAALGCGELLEWRNHSYWPVICNTLSHTTNLNVTCGQPWTIAERSHYVTNNVFQEKKGMRWWEDHIYVDDGDDIDDIDIDGFKEFHYFMQFAVDSAWARHSREYNMLQPWYHFGLKTRILFAKAVCNSPHLFIRWPLLALIYKRIIWDKPRELENENFWFSLKWEELLNEIQKEEAIARKADVNLPPKAFFRRINKTYLKTIYELEIC